MDINLNDGGDNTSVSPNPDLKKSNKKAKIIAISSVITIVILVFVGVTTYIYTTVSKYEAIIMPGVIVEGIDMGSKTKEEAIKELTDKHQEALGSRVINIKAGDKSYNINYSDLQIEYNIEDTVNSAFDYNRDLGYVDKFKAIRGKDKKEFPISFTYNDEVISAMAKTIESEINVEKKNATISKSGGSFNVTDEVVGKTLDVQALINDINTKITENKEGNLDIVATIKDDAPDKTKEKLAAINTQISTFYSNYRASDANRSTNIELGVNTLSGTVLMPGESFSFNTIVGDTTPDKGYKPGGVYVGEKVEIGYGGGICQVSSTLHNAVLRSGITPDQRLNHSMPVGYVDPGLDATISYGSIDYVFTNPYDYPLYLEGYAGGGQVTINIYSHSSVNAGKTYSFPYEVYETTQAPVKYKDDATLEVGKEVVEQAGSQGSKVRAYKVIYQNGAEISRELMNNDTYTPSTKIIKRGTKVPAPKPPAPAPAPAPKPSEPEPKPPIEKPVEPPAEG
ncbi:VanW family protein [Clostridium sp.]|uniref:VanW family protein n=1 Tax=Clostridium sp. TaxID=1506 RepID=UPI003217C51B